MPRSHSQTVRRHQ